jgi:hypothetical protein
MYMLLSFDNQQEIPQYLKPRVLGIDLKSFFTHETNATRLYIR